MYRKIENLKEVLESHLIYLETGDLSKHANLSGASLPRNTDNAEDSNG